MNETAEGTAEERGRSVETSDARPTSDASVSGAASSPALTVYYDGGCPICRREIATYRRAAGAERLDWVDLSSADRAALGEGLSVERAMARMHVRDADGRLIDGAAAFASLWSVLPRTRLLGRLAGTRLALGVLEPAYRLFLKVRPLWR